MVTFCICQFCRNFHVSRLFRVCKTATYKSQSDCAKTIQVFLLMVVEKFKYENVRELKLVFAQTPVGANCRKTLQ
jgi:hypothetical protein